MDGHRPDYHFGKISPNALAHIDAPAIKSPVSISLSEHEHQTLWPEEAASEIKKYATKPTETSYKNLRPRLTKNCV
jgi:hypothetical protein